MKVPYVCHLESPSYINQVLDERIRLSRHFENKLEQWKEHYKKWPFLSLLSIKVALGTTLLCKSLLNRDSICMISNKSQLRYTRPGWRNKTIQPFVEWFDAMLLTLPEVAPYFIAQFQSGSLCRYWASEWLFWQCYFASPFWIKIRYVWCLKIPS